MGKPKAVNYEESSEEYVKMEEFEESSEESGAQEQKIVLVAEDDVPMPLQREKHNYDFSGLQVGQSAFITTKRPGSVRSALFAYAKKEEKRYVSRVAEGGLRIWRTA